MWRQGSPPAPTPSFAAGQAEQLELAVVGVAGALVAHPADRNPHAGGGAEQGSLDPRPRGTHRGAEPERAVAADLVERQRPLEPAARPVRACAPGQRKGAEVVGRAGVDPLLRSGRNEPNVAARADQPQPVGERRHHTEPGCVVVGARCARRRVRVGHDDAQAAARCVVHADHVARASRPGTRNSCTPTRRPAPRNTRLISRWARASRSLAAGRGPHEEILVATPCASAGTGAAAVTATASIVAITRAVPEAPRAP